jgi:hypothetical protein
MELVGQGLISTCEECTLDKPMACNKCTMIDEPQVLETCVKCILSKKYKIEQTNESIVTC